MKRFAMIVTATLLCLIGSTASIQGVFARGLDSAAQIVQAACVFANSFDAKGALYIGKRTSKMDTYSVFSDRDQGWVYRNVIVDHKKGRENIHVDVLRNFAHPYVKGDKKFFGLPEYDRDFNPINYGTQPGGTRPNISYDVEMLPLSATGHNCRQEKHGIWVFRMGDSSQYYKLMKNGTVEQFYGTPIFLN